MIDKDLAQNLVNKLHRQFGYNINIMNENAVIIASSDCSRIGQFHEGAYNIITEKRPVHVAEESESGSLIGIDCGVTLLLYQKGRIAGAFGVTGKPEEVMDVAKILKLTFNTMLEHEYQRSRQNNNANELIESLVFRDHMNIAKIKKCAAENRKDFSGYRLPMVIHVNEEVSDKLWEIMENYRSCDLYHNQDIIFLIDEVTFAIMKKIGIEDCNRYRSYAKDFIAQFKKSSAIHLGSNVVKFLLCDVPIHAIPDYRTVFQHLIWMEGSIAQKESKEILFFSNYIFEYLTEQENAEKKLEVLTEFYQKLIEEKIGVQIFCELAEALYYCNGHVFNMSQKLYIHKNTVIQRINKIKKVLEIDNIRNSTEINFIYYLCLSIRKNYRGE